MSTIRVIYSAVGLDTVVDAALTPETIFNTLKGTYKELEKDGTFAVTSDGDQQVMTVTLKEGKKA